MEIFLRNEVVGNKDLTPEGLGVYIALRSIMIKGIDNYYVSINMLAYILLGTYDSSYDTRRLDANLQAGLDNLINKLKLVTIINKIKTNKTNKNEYVLDLSKLYFSTKNAKETEDYFTIVNSNEINKIMKCNQDKFKLLRYFVVLIGTINKNSFTYTDSVNSVEGFAGALTQDKLGELSDIPVLRVKEYNKILEKEKLIYVHKHDDIIINDDGSIKSLTNVYGRYSDAKWIKKYANDYANSRESFNSGKSVSRRNAAKINSMLQKYNAIDKKGKKYNDDIAKEIYEFIIQYNKKQDNLIKHISSCGKGSSDYIDNQINILEGKKKDISVFKGYSFYDGVDNDNVVSANQVKPESTSSKVINIEYKKSSNGFYNNLVQAVGDNLSKPNMNPFKSIDEVNSYERINKSNLMLDLDDDLFG